MARQWVGDEGDLPGDGPRTLGEIARDLLDRLLGRDR